MACPLEDVQGLQDTLRIAASFQPKAFCGRDLELDAAALKRRGAHAHGRLRARDPAVLARLERLPQVTLAEIGASALGGGLELALACDFRIAAEEARLGLPEPRLGLIPGAGGTQRLPRIAGVAAAKRLILGAEVITGAQAAALGVVHWAVPAAELAARAPIARDIVAAPRLAEAKACIGRRTATSASSRRPPRSSRRTTQRRARVPGEAR
jgi:enoyl-CoA hydratase/carnithine racemase